MFTLITSPSAVFLFFFNDTATTELYTLSLHDALPIQGSVPLVFFLGLFFLVGMLGQGLLISVVTRNQLVATQAGALSALLTSMLLSGMVFPLENMPLPLQLLSRVVPARYFVHA